MSAAHSAGISRTDSPGGPNDPQSALYLRLLDRIRANPAVASAAASVGTPYAWSHATDLRASGRDSLPEVSSGGPYFNAVTDDFFAATGTRIVRGRGIVASDQAAGAPPVAVVGATFARLVWPGGNPIGQCLYVNGNDSTCVQVVGVAQDARSRGVTEAQTLMYYIPFGKHLVPPPINGLLIRTRGPARLAEAQVQRALQRAEPDLPYVPRADASGGGRAAVAILATRRDDVHHLRPPGARHRGARPVRGHRLRRRAAHPGDRRAHRAGCRARPTSSGLVVAQASARRPSAR